MKKFKTVMEGILIHYYGFAGIFAGIIISSLYGLVIRFFYLRTVWGSPEVSDFQIFAILILSVLLLISIVASLFLKKKYKSFAITYFVTTLFIVFIIYKLIVPSGIMYD